MPIMADSFDPSYNEAWSKSQLLGALMMPDTWLYSAQFHGKTVGFALCKSVLDECELLLFGVQNNYQRQSIGQTLLKYVITHCRERRITKLFLEVRANNPAISFYHHNDFKVIGVRRNYYLSKYDELLDALTMSVDIHTHKTLLSK